MKMSNEVREEVTSRSGREEKQLKEALKDINGKLELKHAKIVSISTSITASENSSRMVDLKKFQSNVQYK